MSRDRGWDVRRRRRPPWWPENEPWPPRFGPGSWRYRRTRFERRINAGSAMRMCSDAPTQAMGRFDDRADFVVGELLVESSLDVGEHAAGCHELDRVRTMANLAAHRAATFVHAVANS